MLFRIKSYLYFLWKSTNQHGVHSPFVYSLVTQCFYNRKQRASYDFIKSIVSNHPSGMRFKNAKLINRLLPYLNYENVLILDHSSDFITQILSSNNSISIRYSLEDKNVFDFMYVDVAQYFKNPKLLEMVFSKAHNDSLLLITNIHQSQSNEAIWKQIKNNPKTKVTIDTYDLGFVFFRKEQEKEDFMIRV